MKEGDSSRMKDQIDNPISQYYQHVSIQEPFGNLFRERHVLILIRDQKGQFLFGSKPNFYPKGIVRLIGGGVNIDETPAEAAVRELDEEVHLKKRSLDLYPLAIITTDAETAKQKCKLITSLFFLQLQGDHVSSDSDIRSIVRLNEHKMRRLISNYYNLDQTNWYHGPEGNYSWGDYGKVYGYIHEIALNEYKKQN